jgi:hypothetical protein
MALTFDETQVATLLELLGLPSDTTDVETILATVKDAVAPAEQKPSEVAAAAKRAGLEVVDNDTLAALRHDAAEGRQIKAAAERQKIEASVGDAIAKGKITPSRKRHWIDLISADPGMAEVLAGVPNETAVPMTEIGHGVGNEDGPPKQEGWFY